LRKQEVVGPSKEKRQLIADTRRAIEKLAPFRAGRFLVSLFIALVSYDVEHCLFKLGFPRPRLEQSMLFCVVSWATILLYLHAVEFGVHRKKLYTSI